MFHNQRTVVVKTSNKWKLTIHDKVPLSGNYNYQEMHMLIFQVLLGFSMS